MTIHNAYNNLLLDGNIMHGENGEFSGGDMGEEKDVKMLLLWCPTSFVYARKAAYVKH
jgi:hypothetical protein